MSHHPGGFPSRYPGHGADQPAQDQYGHLLDPFCHCDGGRGDRRHQRAFDQTSAFR